MGLCNFSWSHTAHISELWRQRPLTGSRGVLSRPGLGHPGPQGRMDNPDPCSLPLQVLGTFSTEKDRALHNHSCQASSQPAFPLPRKALHRGQAFVLRVQAWFPSHAPLPRFQGRLAGPLPCGWQCSSGSCDQGLFGKVLLSLDASGKFRGFWSIQCCLMWIPRHSLLIASIWKKTVLYCMWVKLKWPFAVSWVIKTKACCPGWNCCKTKWCVFSKELSPSRFYS